MIKQSRYFRMTSDHECHTLRIYEAFAEDEGVYTCSMGNVSTSARLKIICKYKERYLINTGNNKTFNYYLKKI